MTEIKGLVCQQPDPFLVKDVVEIRLLRWKKG